MREFDPQISRLASSHIPYPVGRYNIKHLAKVSKVCRFGSFINLLCFNDWYVSVNRNLNKPWNFKHLFNWAWLLIPPSNNFMERVHYVQYRFCYLLKAAKLIFTTCLARFRTLRTSRRHQRHLHPLRFSYNFFHAIRFTFFTLHF
jgi:hypothetical protein